MNRLEVMRQKAIEERKERAEFRAWERK
jgi:hypothetical protein